MAVSFRKLHPVFAAEVTSPIDLRSLEDEATLSELRAGMDEYAVLVFPNQGFTNAEQLAFAQRLDGQLNRVKVLAKTRFDNDALVDISNLDENDEILDTYAKRRMYSLGNRLWHTDASFNDPRGRYSMLHARVIPPEGGETEFFYQEKKVQSKAGRMLIFPAGFTHTHRGNKPESGDKYIISTYLLF